MSTADVMEPEVAPPVVDEDKFYEVVDGQRVEKEPMGASEAVMGFELAMAIEVFAKPEKLGTAVPDILFRLRSEPNLQRRPDVAFVSSARWPRGRKIPRGNAWDVVPDLAVEMVSPTNLADEIMVKIGEYFEAGVRRVWVVYPVVKLVYDYESLRSIKILGHDDALEGGEVIPGFRQPLAELFGGDEELQPA